MKLSLEILQRVNDLFVEKGWRKSSFNSTFDRFCERLTFLTPEEQLLVIELAEDYTKIELRNYLNYFYESLSILEASIFNKYKHIYVCPLLDPEKKTSKIKSAAFIYYMFAADDYTWLSNKFLPCTSIKYLYHNFDNRDSLLLLVDDYIGSGETAINVCKQFIAADMKKGNISPSNIKVVSIAAQEKGINEVKKVLNIDVVASMIFKKGISDRFLDEEKNAKLNLMETIEKRMGISDDFRLGFKRSEALITMMDKTPNNTFPIYWDESKGKVAPFPRRKT